MAKTQHTPEEGQEVVFGEVISDVGLFGEPLEKEEDEVEKDESDDDKAKDDKSKDKSKSEEGDKDKEEDLNDANFFGEDDKEKSKDEEDDDKSEDKEEDDSEKVEKGLASDDKKKEKKEEDDDTDYEALADVLVKTGEWKEFEVEGDDKTIDAETFKDLLKQQKELKVTEYKEEALKVLSKDEKDFLEFKKNGGNIDAFVSNYYFKKQAEQLDISTDQGKKNAVYAYYKNFVKWSDERIDKFISRIEKDMELDEEAKIAKEKIEEATKEQFDKTKEAAQKAADKRQESENKYKDDVKEILKNKEYDTKKANVIIRDFTDRDDKGFTVIDKKYLEMRSNPELVDELWSYLMDKDNFIKKVSQKKVNENELDSFKRIVFNKKSKGNVTQKRRKEEEEGEIILQG